MTVGGLDFMDRAGPFLVVFYLGESEVSSYRYLGDCDNPDDGRCTGRFGGKLAGNPRFFT